MLFTAELDKICGVEETVEKLTQNKVIADMWLLLCLVLPLVVQSAPIITGSLPLDCEDIFNKLNSSNTKNNVTINSGMYTIYPIGPDNPMQVYCDMSCNGESSNKWTVIQRRVDGSVNFHRPWADYKKGFGNASGEFWLGLENIFLMTNLYRYELRVDMADFEHGKVYAEYSSFYIESEENNYQLHVSGYTNGGAGDSLSSLMGRPFSTYDKNGNCGNNQMFGGFWYYCGWYNYDSNPNGLYYWSEDPVYQSTYNGITWVTWKGPNYSLKSIQMKIRRVSLSDITG